ncbi:MAG TPA: hypothetical protein QF753_13655 [Victivallales bacterium]|nr:hypothetical protein [Victivallales bacterium]
MKGKEKPCFNYIKLLFIIFLCITANYNYLLADSFGDDPFDELMISDENVGPVIIEEEPERPLLPVNDSRHLSLMKLLIEIYLSKLWKLK